MYICLAHVIMSNVSIICVAYILEVGKSDVHDVQNYFGSARKGHPLFKALYHTYCLINISWDANDINSQDMTTLNDIRFTVR